MAVAPRIELTTLLLCDYAMTSQDGKISAIGIFSQINVNRLPVSHPRLFIVAVLEAEPGPYEIRLQVVSPEGNQVLNNAPTLRIQVPPNASTANIVADLSGLQLAELGRHRVEVRAGDRSLGGAAFNVALVMRQPKTARA